MMPRSSVAQVGVAVMLLLMPSALSAAEGDAARPAAPSFVYPPKSPPQSPPAAAAAPVADPRDQPTIVVDPAACRWVSRHVPDGDVEYRPGVDAQGRAVAPADLPGSAPPVLPQRIEIGITADVARRFGVPPGGAARYGGEAYIGTVTVEGTRVLFNGQPITDQAEHELVALCGRRGLGGSR